MRGSRICRSASFGNHANVGSSGVSTEMGAFGSDPNISPASRGTWSRWRTLNIGVFTQPPPGADMDALRLATIDRASTSSRLAPSNCRIKSAPKTRLGVWKPASLHPPNFAWRWTTDLLDQYFARVRFFAARCTQTASPRRTCSLIRRATLYRDGSRKTRPRPGGWMGLRAKVVPGHVHSHSPLNQFGISEHVPAGTNLLHPS
jgi:hypothetical protein